MTARDAYNNNIGFSGPNAGREAENSTFNTNNHSNFMEIDLKILQGELAVLRRAMVQDAIAPDKDDPEKLIAAAAVAHAEKSAQSGDAKSTFGYLKAAGKWAGDVATKIGTNLAAKAIETAINMPPSSP